MRTSAFAKAVTVGVPTGLWLAFGAAGLGRTLAVIAGAALIALAWVRLEQRAAVRAARVRVAVEEACDRQRKMNALAGAPVRRIDRTPTGRSARDVRCAASRATARARRSTRR